MSQQSLSSLLQSPSYNSKEEGKTSLCVCVRARVQTLDCRRGETYDNSGQHMIRKETEP